MSFIYETHMHTRQGSACGRCDGKDHVQFYIDQGYTGIIITDHFFGGNTAADRSAPWAERVNQYCSGYEDAWEEGQKRGLDVFFGIEQNYQGDEYLIYGLDKAYLLAHPEMEHWTRRQQLEEVHKAGGCVIQAHPFRFRDYMDRIRLGSMYFDGCEVANAGNHPWDDARAIRWAKANGFVMTAGSDNHFSPSTDPLFGIELEEKLHSIQDLVKVVLEKKPIGLHVPESRFMIQETTPAEKDLVEAWDLNEKEERVLNPKNWLYDTEL